VPIDGVPGARRRLLLIKVVHTTVWAVFVACILGVYAAASGSRFGLALGLALVVFGECLVLLVNRMRCPLTPLAARYTDDRRTNFDIFLPQWLAQRNQSIFGALYLAGVLYALTKWWLAR